MQGNEGPPPGKPDEKPPTLIVPKPIDREILERVRRRLEDPESGGLKEEPPVRSPHRPK